MMRFISTLTAMFLLFPTLCGALPKKQLKYPQLKGKIIRNVIIKLADVFDDSDSGFIYRQANNLKISTKDDVIRREVLLKEGSTFNEVKLEESERNLRAYRFLRKVSIKPVEDGGFVDLIVYAQDTWTIIPQVGFSTGTGSDKVSAGLIEHNLLGYGKKIGMLYSKEDERTSLQTIYEDSRVWGTQTSLLTGLFDRNDGTISFFNVGRPFRSYTQKGSWSFNDYQGDTIGRLFSDGNEYYIFRQHNVNVNARYSVQTGDPESIVHRLSFGYDYISDTFDQADESDYEDLNLNPADVSNDPANLASNRKFTGPSLGYHYIEPNFISRNYIDRFDRIDDYNMGTEYSVSSIIAPEAIGSDENTFLLSASRSGGWKFGNDSFLRGEMGYASRYDKDGAANTLYRGEIKYYDVLGPKYLGEQYIGKHTLAFSFFMDYAVDLDKDRQFLVGGDNVVRGYKAKTFDGDKRYGINIEDRIHFVDDAFQLVSLGGAVFFDGGGATYDPLGQLITDGFYSDVGFGLRIAFPRSTGSQVLRVDISYPLRDGPDGSEQFEPRILLSGGQIFDSHLRSETLGTEKANIDIGFDR